jgi:predicted DNA-binding transcriptional regulator AlpA
MLVNEQPVVGINNSWVDELLKIRDLPKRVDFSEDDNWIQTKIEW